MRPFRRLIVRVVVMVEAPDDRVLSPLVNSALHELANVNPHGLEMSKPIRTKYGATVWCSAKNYYYDDPWYLKLWQAMKGFA